MIKRESKAHWSGGLKSGKGEMLSGKNGQKADYTFSSRFEEEEGSNPEELLAAAHAGCFSMAFSGLLEKEGFAPENIDTNATIAMDQKNGSFEITEIELSSKAKVPGIDKNKFNELAEKARENCPVSRLFKGAAIRVNATLE